MASVHDWVGDPTLEKREFVLVHTMSQRQRKMLVDVG
jgi:hypothetical protein